MPATTVAPPGRAAPRRGAGDAATARTVPVESRYRLLRNDARVARRTPSAEQRVVIDHPGGRLRVLAGPGTGKTETIVEAVADRIERRGLDPSSVLVLTFSRRAAAELTQRIAARLSVTVTEPLVRTLHSYAYALVRSAAAAEGDPPPRLLEAGQADVMVREMLAGHADGGAADWPPHLRAALRVPAFAAELREFGLRAAQRQITPRQMAALGRRMRRPEWCAAAAFLTEYRDIADLRQASSRLGAALDQAELTTAALDRLADPRVLAQQRARIRRIFVDEYQDVDPAQAALVELLAAGADELVVVGDPDQSIYAFRGAVPGALERLSVDRTVALTVSHRLAAALLTATRRVAARLPGPAAHRATVPGAPDRAGEVQVRVLPSAAQEAAFVADELRRAHLEGGVAWSRMAVLLRSPGRSVEALARACAVAGVPMAAAAAGPVAGDPLVAALLAVLRGGAEPASLTGPVALGLIASPLGGMDPVAIRRLRRAVRQARAGGTAGTAAGVGPGGGTAVSSSGALLAAVLRGDQRRPPELPADLARPLDRLTGLVALAREGAAEPAAETVLWRVWQRSGLAASLSADCERGGRGAAVADVMLDAAVQLFQRAAELADQLPGVGVRGLLDLVGGEQIPTAPTGPARDVDAVSVLSAHAAKGLEWDVVAVAGVQQDGWPDLRPRASLLDVDALLDAAAGIRDPLPAAGRLADERRLFYVAVTRARRCLVVTAVQDDENTPSRFLAELAGTDDLPSGWPPGPRGRPRRALNLPALVAELRRAVCSPGGDEGGDRRRPAAIALARLAAARVPGAHPDDWYGLATPSSTTPLVPDGREVVVSPSQVESLLDCPLRAVLERNGARGAASQAQLLGIAVHALAQGIAEGATAAELAAAADAFVAAQEQLPAWERARLRRTVGSALTALQEWVRDQSANRVLVGAELPVDVLVPDPGAGPDAHPIRIAGRVDRLSLDRQGRLVVTDFKSGATPPSRASVQEHAQLAVYQLAAALGAFTDDRIAPAPIPADRSTGASGDTSADIDPSGDRAAPRDGTGARPVAVGGAELVYLRTGRPKTLAQAAQSERDRERWTGLLRDAARSAAGATLVARQGDGCERCPVRSSCPVQPEGRQVTR